MKVGQRELRAQDSRGTRQQSWLQLDKWRYNSILAMTNDQVPSTKSLLAANTTSVFLPISFFFPKTDMSKKAGILHLPAI